MRPPLVLVLAVGLIGGAATVLAPATPAADRAPVPIPDVRELTGGIKGHPFNALPFDPAEVGYTETEYLVSGLATAYDVSPVALRATGISTPAVAPYATRMLVRRPANPKDFNGSVVVEWANVTSGYDVEASFGELHRLLLREGYAYVAVTAQEVGAVGLRAFDPVRYAPVVHPGDQFSYDMFSQAVQAVRHGVLAGLTVDHVLATGASQSGSALNSYLRYVAPKVERVIDGFLVLTATAPLDALEVPVVRVLSESEAGAGYEDGPLFREWEIASATHVDKPGGDYFDRTQSRDFFPGWPLTPRDVPFPTGECLIGRLPKWLVMHAALDALDRWVDKGVAAPHAPRLAVAADGSLARDPVTDNTVAGIRTPAADAPVASYYGDKDQCAPTLGKTVPFAPEKLRQLYPTHASYVEKVRRSARAAVAAGFMLADDARAVVTDAEASPIGA